MIAEPLPERLTDAGIGAGCEGGAARQLGRVAGAGDAPDVGIDRDRRVLVQREQTDAVRYLLADPKEAHQLLLSLFMRCRTQGQQMVGRKLCQRLRRLLDALRPEAEAEAAQERLI